MQICRNRHAAVRCSNLVSVRFAYMECGSMNAASIGLINFDECVCSSVFFCVLGSRRKSAMDSGAETEAVVGSRAPFRALLTEIHVTARSGAKFQIIP
jgi:hypothetical protein